MGIIDGDVTHPTTLVPGSEPREIRFSESFDASGVPVSAFARALVTTVVQHFPMLARELPGFLATDTELPEFSRFLDATVATGTGNRWDVTITDTAGVTIAKGNELQVVQGSRRRCG